MTTRSLPANMSAKIVFTPAPFDHLGGDCWDWTGAFTSRGYGSVSHGGRIWSTHRLTYTLLIGEIPEGLQIDHLCMRKSCCNPSHLEPVTGKVNAERTSAATKPRCVNGHPLAGPNLRIKKKVSGGVQRECRACCSEAKSRLDDERGRKRKPSQAVLQRRARLLAESETVLSISLNCDRWESEEAS